MKREMQAKLKGIFVQSTNVHIDSDKIQGGAVKFAAEGKSELRIPKKENDTTILLVSSLKIRSQEDEAIFSAEIVANIFFDLGERLSDYDDVITKQCLPIVQKEMQTTVNKIMSDMGYPNFFNAQ